MLDNKETDTACVTQKEVKTAAVNKVNYIPPKHTKIHSYVEKIIRKDISLTDIQRKGYISIEILHLFDELDS